MRNSQTTELLDITDKNKSTRTHVIDKIADSGMLDKLYTMKVSNRPSSTNKTNSDLSLRALWSILLTGWAILTKSPKAKYKDVINQQLLGKIAKDPKIALEEFLTQLEESDKEEARKVLRELLLKL